MLVSFPFAVARCWAFLVRFLVMLLLTHLVLISSASLVDWTLALVARRTPL